ncbi:MAG TPA: hypothetical protein DHD79_08535, partial [Firmicutes bacterium]|nr:hypothetical protein [Bacillota bacterium]
CIASQNSSSAPRAKAMNDSSLTQLTEAVARDTFGRSFGGRAAFNSRFRSRGGDVNVKQSLIRVSRRLYEEHGQEAVIGVLRHELCHLFLFRDGLPYTHRSKEFKELAAAVDAPRFAPPIERNRQPKRYRRFYYACPVCGSRFKTNAKIHAPCPHCHQATLLYTGTRKTTHPL